MKITAQQLSDLLIAEGYKASRTLILFLLRKREDAPERTLGRMGGIRVDRDIALEWFRNYKEECKAKARKPYKRGSRQPPTPDPIMDENIALEFQGVDDRQLCHQLRVIRNGVEVVIWPL